MLRYSHMLRQGPRAVQVCSSYCSACANSKNILFFYVDIKTDKADVGKKSNVAATSLTYEGVFGCQRAAFFAAHDGKAFCRHKLPSKRFASVKKMACAAMVLCVKKMRTPSHLLSSFYSYLIH